MSQPESRLQRRIRLALRRRFGGFWYKVHGGPYTPRGIPDLSGTGPSLGGRWVVVEVKTSDGELSEIQRARISELLDSGAIACTARTPEEAVAHVEAMSRRPTLRFCTMCETPVESVRRHDPRETPAIHRGCSTCLNPT